MPGQPLPRIPARAEERITQRDPSGEKSGSEFWLNGKLVGRAFWDHDGTTLCMAYGLSNGRVVGYHIEYHDNGMISYIEPFVHGAVHGWVKQYSQRGRLLLASPFQQGTGVDYFCNERGQLHEEHPSTPRGLSGCDRWWNEDQRTVYRETTYQNGKRHGVARYWVDGKLDRGYPKFFLRDQEVSKSDYLAAGLEYRREDDSPERTFPEHFVRLRKRALRLEARRRQQRKR